MSAIADSTSRAVVGPLFSTGRLVARLALGYGPIVVAWMIAGNLGRYLTVQIAGWVGAWNALAGLALMPFAILAMLVALVAILLAFRDGMPQLSAIAPVPHRAAERRREFVDAVLAGILPFFAFYVAWGFLRPDMSKYYRRLTEVLAARDQLGGSNTGTLTLTWVTGGVIVITFVLRRVAKRFNKRGSRLLPLIAVYLEAVWVFLSLMVIRELINGVFSWVSTRQGIVWIDDLRAAIAARAAPLDWILEFAGWFIGEFGGLVLLPIAWLTIAGVIYGQAIEPPSARSSLVAQRLGLDASLDRVRQRLGGVPGWLRRRVQDLWSDLIDRLRPVGNAFRLMWHVGPVMIAGYVLFFYAADWFQAMLKLAVVAAIGPRPIEFWRLYDEAIFLIPPVLAAPIGFGVIAAGYDAALAKSGRPPAEPDGEPAPDVGSFEVSTDGTPTHKTTAGTATTGLADDSGAEAWAPPGVSRPLPG